MQQRQSGTMLVPGGYLICILMEKLPGGSLYKSFHRFTLEERKEIRAAFRKALLYVSWDPVSQFKG
jgi:hypothetical protein